MTEEPPRHVGLTAFGEVFRASVVAISVGVFAWPLCCFEASVGAMLGAFLGALSGYALGQSRIRTLALLVCVFVFGVSLLVARSLWFGSDVLNTSLGPVTGLRFGQTLVACTFAFVFSLGLRFLSSRIRLWSVAELAVVAFAFGQLLSAHRGGSINRPFGFADPIIAAGIDPTNILIAFGAIAAAFAILLLFSERHLGRSALHLFTVAALLTMVGLGTHVVGPLMPEPEENVPLRGEKEDAEQEKKGNKRQEQPKQNSGDAYFDQTPPPPHLAQAPIGVVLFHDDYSPPQGWYYFRQSALSQYNGRRLVAANAKNINDDLAFSFPQTSYNIEGAPSVGKFRRAVETSMALLVDDHTQPPALEAPIKLTPATNPDTSRFRRIYRVESAVVDADVTRLLGAKAGSRHWGKTEWSHFVNAPDDPRYGALNKEIFDTLPAAMKEEPIVKALAISAWLGHKGKYSLKHRHIGKEDPTASFLFGDLTGYCVHFSHAAVFLMRQAGLPARVATGYAVDESTRQGGSSLMLMDADSHAWPEVYIEDAGWVVVDVAPQTNLDQPAPQRDADLQKLLGELARGAKPVVANQESIEAGLSRLKRWGTIGFQMVMFSLIAFVLAMFAIKLWRMVLPLMCRDQALARVQYRALLDRLSEVSRVRKRGESREAFARRLSEEFPVFGQVTLLHLAGAFGGSTPQLESMRSLASRMSDDRRRAFSLWRRAVGALNPISWWWSR